ncbi:gamma-cadinene synthase-like [Salvia divinorum]|uniref:Gamma-cadinene synthase-like n=1 Tax=Salvia divinorum TaxID=28513 RepID=A0ABD1GFY0_SALDI
MAAANMVSVNSSNVRHIRPPTLSYKPSMWGNIFSTYSFDNQIVQEKYYEEMEALTKETGRMLMAAESTKLLILIDKIERLGVAYLFEKEIEEKLRIIYESTKEDEDNDDDLLTTSLRFRLLRQHQYAVSCDVFNKFVEKDCKWKPESHGSNVEGILSLVYRKELVELTRWWDKFDQRSKLPYARDRVVECYLWGNAFNYEPQYSYLRVTVAKNMQLVSIMDDTYDNYATLEEDDLFTEILERWNLDEIDVLPDFMKVVYRFIMSTYEDFVVDAEKNGKSFVVPYYRETVKQLGRAYNKEQKWIMERKMPGFEEYMTNSQFSGSSVSPKLSFPLPRWVEPLEDLGSHEHENREGKLPTVVDCYMKDKGVSKQDAIIEFVELVENGWKDVTAEWAKGSSSVPKEMVEQLLNYGRIAEITYNNKEDGYTDPEKYLGPLIAALFVDPLPLHV